MTALLLITAIFLGVRYLRELENNADRRQLVTSNPWERAEERIQALITRDPTFIQHFMASCSVGRFFGKSQLALVDTAASLLDISLPHERGVEITKRTAGHPVWIAVAHHHNRFYSAFEKAKVEAEQEARSLAREFTSVRSTVDLLRLTPQEFERAIARAFEVQGFNARVKGGSGDHGVDVIASNSNRRIAIQCKRYASDNYVGAEELRNFVGSTIYNEHFGAELHFFTTSGFTQKAKEFCRGSKLPMRLYSGTETVAFINESAAIAGKKSSSSKPKIVRLNKIQGLLGSDIPIQAALEALEGM